MQEEILTLVEPFEKCKQGALVLFVGQNAINNRLECLTKVEMEVLEQDVLLGANSISQINLFKYVATGFNLL